MKFFITYHKKPKIQKRGSRMINKIQAWHQEAEHEKIIHTITALPKEDQTGVLLSLLARALINNDNIAEAIKTLDSISETDQDGFYYVRYGLALFLSHKEHEALGWFEKANKMGVKEFDELPGSYYPNTMSEWLSRAKTWAPRRMEKLAFEKDRRAARNKQAVQADGFDTVALDGLWDDCDYALEEYVGEAPSDEDFERVEQALGYRLPDSYKALMKMHNGGLLAKNTFNNPLQCDWTPSTYNVASIFGVDASKSYSLCGNMGSRFWIEEWGYPDLGIAICDTISGGHNIIFLDYSDCGPQGEPCVVEINQERNYEITYLADHFKEFISGLFEDDDEDYSEDEDYDEE